MKQARTLSEKVEAWLLYQLVYGKYRVDRRLPPETVIAKDFGVSRNVVRSSMSVLEREGYISRRRGVGTIVNQHVLDIRTRMDIADEFQNIIESAGCKASCSHFSLEQAACDERVAQLLHIASGEPVLCISRVMTANGTPAVYCHDYVALSQAHGMSAEAIHAASEISTFELLMQANNAEVYMAVSDVSAIGADETLCGLCGMRPGEPVLYIEAVHYSFSGQALFLSQEYYMNSLICQTMVRKKIYSPKERGDENFV